MSKGVSLCDWLTSSASDPAVPAHALARARHVLPRVRQVPPEARRTCTALRLHFPAAGNVCAPPPGAVWLTPGKACGVQREPTLANRHDTHTRHPQINVSTWPHAGRAHEGQRATFRQRGICEER